MPDRLDRKDSRGGESRNYYRAVAMLASIPFTLGVAPLVGWWLGRFADRRLDTGWVFQAIGLVAGLAAAVRETVVLIRRVQKDLG